MFFSFDDTGRVMICAEEAVFPGMVELVPPYGFTTESQADWLYTGEWVHDPLPVPEAVPTPEERIAALEKELAAAKILLGVE